ncbi:RNA-guided endonuclease TnpB family protein [Lactobacillus crispatus]|uniref:IS200/IS605 family element transposase accessory protein TnpB n=1 Tax=Lactobacillus crispatus TaxID=47770 RepID=A0AB73BPW1_9LACO|nr:RNA-guided endonuclease TnpB family protein [Lactobacillus crispatus]KAA8780374.1 IS200/IS605 family element transposase accessory protein TnpB [Lactobacillus crispatus]KAA8793372.1 IS200/IS605 family element transposase accessory protein TnpB [Lactobacillus crispatus]KAA8797934.1 IS200/IS605 family element transposase accessory protein TnpB [Lactobacillus crispatus]KAA8801036.1 IS200/IS605 family element transposase accessory protein TnpB [Lactobacillus crispatus]KAA8803359.1 IS200/IS605 f
MLKGIKLRLYPNKLQQDQLWQMFGNDRFVWNQMLAMMNERYKNNKKLPFLSKFKLDCLLKPLKQEYPFLKKSDSSSLQVVNASLNQAWKNFFSDKTGKVGKPRFHSRKYLKYSYTGKSVVQVIGKRYLKMPKLGYIKTSKTNILKDTKIKRYTVVLEPTGKYYLSLQVEAKTVEKFKQTGRRVGIDVGVADLAILSNGLKYPSFDSSYYEKKATNWQRRYSRRRHLTKLLCLQDKNRKALNPRSLDSFSNWQKAQRAKAVYQAKIAFQRKDYLHKLTTHLVKQYDVIVIEDLKVKNLQKNHLAKAIANASWSMFRQMLEYKCQWYGKKLIAVDPKNTSRICSKCGYNSGEKPLDIREWTCPKCQAHHDRDINAAINILNKAKPVL